ncbi:hypothetical protein [uncultured Microbulbifer sp.]|uniref:hypothetical protein n=1 Tax=uncultured Microbulbifer sp. TaxID=348147 RepID=UPI00262E94C1|nr:hypothetical protein [uncultured Microbulbifer sp.]
MSTYTIPKGAKEPPPKVEMIDGRQVKVVHPKSASETSKRLTAKYSRALNILKNR